MGIESKGNGGIRAVVLSAIIVLAMVGGPTAVVGGTDTDDPLTDEVGETLNETSDDGGTTDLDDTDEGDSTESDGDDDSSTADGDEDSTSTSDSDDSTTDEVAESADDVEDTGGAVTDAAGDGTDEVTDGATIDRVLTGTIDTGSLESRIVGVAGVYERSGSGAATQQTASTTDDGGSEVESDPGSVGITAGATNQPGIATQGEGPATFNFTESEPGAFPDSGTVRLRLPEEGGVTFDPGNTSAAATVDGGSGTVTDVAPTLEVINTTGSVNEGDRFTLTVETSDDPDTVTEEVRDDITEKQRKAMHTVAQELKDNEFTANELDDRLFGIKDDIGLETSEFFETAYRCLLNTDDGPRLSNFIMGLGQERVAGILETA